MKLCRLFVLAAFVLLFTPLSFSQSTRSWVSGTGDDTNPGSRNAPCLTFAGVFSKTAPFGEIDVLDPGSFGAVTLTKSLTLDGRAALGSIITTTNNAVTVTGPAAPAAPIVVTLRDLNLNGLKGGLAGIKVTGSVELRVVHCTIYGFTGAGIDFEGGDGSTLFMENCDVHDCAGGGVLLAPSASTASPPVQGNSTAKLENSSISECGMFGVSNQAGSTSHVDGVKCSGITGPAFSCAAGTKMTIARSSASLSSSGVTAAGTVFLTDSDVIANLGAGLASSGGGGIYTPRNNRVAGNAPDGTALPYVVLK